MYNIPSALDATANQFFRAPAPSSIPAPTAAPTRFRRDQAGAIGGGVVNIDKDTLSSGSDLSFSREASTRLKVRAGLERPVSKHLSVIGGVSLSQGHSQYFLPQGAGVLVDPITINFRTTGLELDAGLAMYAGKKIESRIELGVGGTLARTRTRINSALLNVENSSSHKAGFVYTRAQLRLKPDTFNGMDVRLEGMAKFYPGIGVSINSGVALGF